MDAMCSAVRGAALNRISLPPHCHFLFLNLLGGVRAKPFCPLSAAVVILVSVSDIAVAVTAAQSTFY